MNNQTEILKPIPQAVSPGKTVPVYHPDQHSTFNSNFVRLTQQHWELNGLYQSLSALIGHGNAVTEMFLYNLGTSKRNGGSTIFWQQQDNNPNVYTGGLIMKYDSHSGEAVDNYFTTVHEAIADRYNIEAAKPPSPNLIGSHLVREYQNKPIIIVTIP